MRQTIKNTSVTLSSWKEIAEYLDRGVRTVQRWEQDLDLPVHLIGKGKRSPVYATTSELNFWMATSEAAREQKLHYKPLPAPSRHSKPIDDSRRLLMSVHELSRKLAEASVRQHKQAEILQNRILQMQKRIK
jgi:hypothetical protein